jgi:hypothetical protein
MARAYITTSAETQVSGACKKVLIQVNAALTGTIKVIDNDTGSTANVATITNPTVGSQYEYYDFTVGVRIVASGACDITVNTTDQSR